MSRNDDVGIPRLTTTSDFWINHISMTGVPACETADDSCVSAPHFRTDEIRKAAIDGAVTIIGPLWQNRITGPATVAVL